MNSLKKETQEVYDALALVEDYYHEIVEIFNSEEEVKTIHRLLRKEYRDLTLKRLDEDYPE